MRSFGTIVKSHRENNKRASVTVYITLRALVLACVVLQIIAGEFDHAFLCLFYWVLLMLPILVQDKFKIEFPNLLEIAIYLFIFSGTILGGIYNFYGNVPHWDTLLHVINGFICAGIGFALVDLLNKNGKKIRLSPFYTVFVAFCFSMTVGVLWEFYEYGADKITLTDMQKDAIVKTVSTVELNPLKNNRPVVIKNIAKTIMYDRSGNELAVIEGGYLDIGLNDTMKDMIFNCVGAISFSILGYFYLKNKEKYKFTRNFIPKRAEKTVMTQSKIKK